MLVLDADPAGLKATARSAALALAQGLRVKAARLPKGSDPADLLSTDAKEFGVRVATAKPIVEFFLNELADLERDPHRLLQRAETIVLPLIAAMPSPMEREHFIQSAAQALGLSPEAVRESLRRVPAQSSSTETATAGSKRTEPSSPASRSARESRREKLLALMQVYAGTPLAERVKSRYVEITEAEPLSSPVLPESVLFFVEQTFGESPNEGAADELLHAFESAVVREAYQEAVTELRRAEAAGETSAIERAQAVCAQISLRLATLG